jgi:2,3-dihydroxy-p-cumate/2,3-dihydroxybenzoate 3,4-dioxygenase
MQRLTVAWKGYSEFYPATALFLVCLRLSVRLLGYLANTLKVYFESAHMQVSPFLHDICYVRLGTQDLAGACRFSSGILGLRESARVGNPKTTQAVYFRSDARDHTLMYFDGDPRDHTVGFEVRDRLTLDQISSNLDAMGIRVWVGSADQCEARRVKSYINFKDPSGNSIDLVVAPHHSGIRFFPERDSGITGFSHIGLRTTSAARDELFWTQTMGAKVSDRIGDAALLRIDEVHHKIALFPSSFAGVQHINHQVESIDDLMRSWYFLTENKVRIVFGPGKHPTSSAMFLYFEGPDGMVFEYSTGVRNIMDPSHQPRQFPFTPTSFCMWGSRPDITEFKP